MNLPIKLPIFGKKIKVEYFLALLLRDEKVTAITFKQSGGVITIIGTADEQLQDSLEQTSIDDLTNALDKAISHAEEKIPEDIQTQNTVFGVKESWVEEKTIKKDYLKKLKYVSEKLNLVPIGFIVLSEAIAHLINEEEGAPLSALLTDIGTRTVTVSLFRAGKLIETKYKNIETTAMEAVDRALKEFERVEIFPSRVILFHAVPSHETHKNDVLAQEFIAHQWSKGLPFLHVPQISILPSGFDGKAIVAGAATQLGFSLSGITIANHSDIQTVQQRDLEHHSRKHHSPDTSEENETKDIKQSVEDNVTPDNFGFVMNKDILIDKIEETDKADLQDTTTQNPREELENRELHNEVEAHEELVEESEHETSTSKKKLFSFPKFLPSFALLKNRHLPFTDKISIKNRVLFIPPFILLGVIGLLLLYMFTVKATVTLGIVPIQADETTKITFVLAEENNFEQNSIKATPITAELEGSVSTETTGEKEVGNKAKGTVTIYNSGSSKRTLKEGTTVTSDNGLSYITDKEISVASASGDIFSGIKSGTAQVAITAKKIGTEYNLPSNTKFSIEGATDVAAKNDAAFSGGSKKKVTVVTKKDTDKLLAELPKKLEENAKQTLTGKLGNDEVLIGDFREIEITKKTFDKDIDEEAKTVNLKGTVIFTTYMYNRSNMQDFIKSLLSKKYSDGNYNFNEDFSVNISGIKKVDDTEITSVAEIKTGLIPKLDTKAIAKNLAGKSFSQAQEYSKSLKQVQQLRIQLHPDLPLIPKLLPRLDKNITVVIQPN